jgi:hypothetical protein
MPSVLAANRLKQVLTGFWQVPTCMAQLAIVSLAEAVTVQTWTLRSSDCTVIEQRAVVRLLWAERVKPADIHRRILAQYGSVNCTGHRNFYEWIARFKSGRTSVSDEAQSGRPSTSRPQDHIHRSKALIRENWRISVSEVAEMPDISSGSASAILHDDFMIPESVCQMGP